MSESGKPQMSMSMQDMGLYQFDGNDERYPDFKELFIASTEHLSDRMKLLKLRQYLHPKGRDFINYLSAEDPFALAQAWHDLDQLHGLDPDKPNFHLTKLLSALTWPVCKNLDDLLEFYSFLIDHYSKTCKGGPDYMAQAEAIKHGISSRLYGWSKWKVHDLQFKNDGEDFNLGNILEKIKLHIRRERQLQLANQVANNFTHKTRNGRDYNNYYSYSNRNRSSSRNRYNTPPCNSYSSEYARPYNQSPSRDNAQSQNRYNHYNSPSRNSYNYNSTYGRSPSRDRNYLPTQRQDRQPRERNRTPTRNHYTNSPKDGSERGSYAHAFKIQTESDNKTIQNDKGRSPRYRSPSPYVRGNRSPSPAVHKVHHKCLFCKNSEHFSLNCTQVASEDALKRARQDRLCFVCLMPFHGASTCPYPHVCTQKQCQSPDVLKHATILCKALNKQ